MRSTLRWTVVMAILGFILGLGFLIPLPPTESRAPAAVQDESKVEAFGWNAPDEFPAPHDDTASEGVTDQTALVGGAAIDHRKDTLFDVHTISRSRIVNDTDAYVTTRFRHGGREEIQYFEYCHNYDNRSFHARTDLSRYSLGSDRFPCYVISMEKLAKGYALSRSALGDFLALKSQTDFDPRKGGSVSFIFAYHVAKIGRNDYRQLNLHITLTNGTLKIVGPKGEAFDWLNLGLTEDYFNFPNGVNSFEFYSKGAKVSEYAGKAFPKPKTR